MGLIKIRPGSLSRASNQETFGTVHSCRLKSCQIAESIASSLMKPLFRLGPGCLAVIGVACLAEAQRKLTFDALLPGSDWQPIQSGYGGLQWDHFAVFAGASRLKGRGTERVRSRSG